ncbi:MAG: hypothetical protein HQL23_02910 [Candidatus Omnitrophica bacterium]|nr:hypothetical protein [Candidatus Omnitrophota bacterium]
MKTKLLFLISFLMMLLAVGPLWAAAQDTRSGSNAPSGAAALTSSSELVTQAWEASSKRDFKRLDQLVRDGLEHYGAEADREQKILKNFPLRGEESAYAALNDVGTLLFVQAEAIMNDGRCDDASKAFLRVIKNYSWAQAWDPSRGSFWSIAEKSQDSVDVCSGKSEEEDAKHFKKTPRTRPYLATPGTDKIIDYTKYGQFIDVGTDHYKYSIADLVGLANAAGEGIYPNENGIYKNPRYRQYLREGKLKGRHWDYVNTDDLEAAYFKWVTAPEPWGVRLFYLGMIFEKAEMYYEALKAYHALVVHLPNTVSMTYWQTPWYPAQAAVAKIRHIIRVHPELGLDYKWMNVKVLNGFDNDTKNDVFITYPGKIFKKGMLGKVKDTLNPEERCSLGKVIKRLGEGEVRLVQYENMHWQLMVHDQPYVIKGMTYAPTKVGQSPDKGTLADWMTFDSNNDGLLDGPYEAWVDKNHNDIQDPNEKSVGDFQLMKEMGVNTLRMYHQPFPLNKAVLRDLFKRYGIRIIIGDFLGKYTFGSGASWSKGTDYEDPEQKKKMMASVRDMVLEHKDEPYVLLWLLGNENNYGVACNADKKPEAYFKFVDEVAQMIKSLDSNHPVAIANGDTLFLDIFAKYSPNVDIFGANVYRGDYGFGAFWEQVFDATGRPAMITEYGCPAFAANLNMDEAETAQMNYHQGNWMDIEENLAGRSRGVGNALGGVAFEWTDEWWKNYEPFRHDRKSNAIGPFPGGLYYEEWFGMTSQGKGQHSPFERQLRKVYFYYAGVWNKKFF